MSSRVLLGTAPGDEYGYGNPVRIYVNVNLRRQSSFGQAPRERETTDHRTVIDPVELSVTFDIIGPSGTDIGGGAMGLNGIAEVVDRKQPEAVFDRLARLIPWHLNGLSAGCAHQIADGWNRRRIDPSKPANAYGIHFPGQSHASWNLLGWVRESEHPDGLMSRPHPTCGYRYGTAWLCRELPPEIIADAVAFGAVVPPDRSDPAVIMAEAE